MQNEISSIFRVIFNLQSLSGARIDYYVSVHKPTTRTLNHDYLLICLSPLTTGVPWDSKNVLSFCFWDAALQVELLVLSFVRSLPEADFSLYVDSMTKLVLWCFSLDLGHGRCYHVWFRRYEAKCIIRLLWKVKWQSQGVFMVALFLKMFRALKCTSVPGFMKKIYVITNTAVY